MERIYQDLKDRFVASVIVYEADGKAYYDAEHTKGVTPEELKDLFIKNALVVSAGDNLYRATGYTAEGAVYNDTAIAGVEAEA